jgi:hypothetical protein
MRPRLRAIVCAALAAALGGLPVGLAPPAAYAQSSGDDSWNPFKQPEKPPRRSKAPPPDKVDLRQEPSSKGRNRGEVESSDLAPVLVPDATGLPLNLWGGLDMGELERLLAALDLPPRSPALHQLWRRMLQASAGPPGGAPSPDHFLALRLEALYRSGLLADIAEAVEKSGSSSALAKIFLARKEIGLGDREAGCRTARTLVSSGLSGRLKGEALLLMGYCAAASDDGAAAGLAASLAREEGLAAEVALAVLDGAAAGSKTRLPLPARVSLLDYRFLQLTGAVAEMEALGRAEPALLVVLAEDAGSNARLQTAAAEAALRLNAVTPESVARVYRRQADGSLRPTSGQEKAADPILRRAHMFVAIEATQNPDMKARLLRAFLDDARRAGMAMQAARLLALSLEGLWPSPSTAILAEQAVEIALAAGDYEAARRWAETSAALQHWLALIDVAGSAPRGGKFAGLGYMDELAARGRLGPEVLHRLATLLDALDIDVPRAIWEAAGRIPQPATGYLPATGVLAELAAVAKLKEPGRTALTAMRAFGPNSADGVNILVLGDAVRGLKRAGLEADARRLALEALLAVWPRALGR